MSRRWLLLVGVTAPGCDKPASPRAMPPIEVSVVEAVPRSLREPVEFMGEGAGIGDGLGGVGLELGFERLAERDRLGGDNMHERAAL